MRPRKLRALVRRGRGPADPVAALTAADMPANPRNLGLVDALDGVLLHRSGASVALLAGDGPGRLERLLADRYPSASVERIAGHEDTSELHTRLTSLGRLDLLIDDTRHLADRTMLFESTFPFLRPGGAFLVRGFRAGPRPTTSVLGFLAELLDAKGRRLPKRATRQQRDDAFLASTLGKVEVDRQHLVVARNGSALAKVAEHEIGRLLELRPDRGRVISSEPASEFLSRATVRESDSARSGRLPGSYQVPGRALREYYDVVCRPGQVVVQGNAVLPDSYRHFPQRRLQNASLEDVAVRFAKVLPGGTPAALPGSYYYLDSEYRGHYGHAMTEQVSRLWGWQRAKAEVPDLKVLMTIRRRELAQFELDLYGAAGIDPSDVVLVREPVRVERLFVATPQFSMPRFVNPAIEETWTQLGRTLAAQAPTRAYPDRIFLVRRPKKRRCRNAAEVEALFVEHGFHLVFAEDHTMAEQAKMFREAEAVAGLAGSAMFTLCLAETPKRVFVVSSESFVAINEYMIGSVRGHELDIAWCRPEIPMPEEGWDQRAFFSPFTFDWDREGKFMRDALGSL